jgi:hypothetical protein
MMDWDVVDTGFKVVLSLEVSDSGAQRVVEGNDAREPPTA